MLGKITFYVMQRHWCALKLEKNASARSGQDFCKLHRETIHQTGLMRYSLVKLNWGQLPPDLCVKR